MTFTTRELRSAGVSAEVVEMRAYRRRLGLSQAEFAHLLCVSESCVQRVETGCRPMTPDFAARMNTLRAEWKESMRPPRPIETRGRRLKSKSMRGECRRCGCTDGRACEGGCAWVDDAHTLCSACAGDLP